MMLKGPWCVCVSVRLCVSLYVCCACVRTGVGVAVAVCVTSCFVFATQAEQRRNAHWPEHPGRRVDGECARALQSSHGHIHLIQDLSAGGGGTSIQKGSILGSAFTKRTDTAQIADVYILEIEAGVLMM